MFASSCPGEFGAGWAGVFPAHSVGDVLLLLICFFVRLRTLSRETPMAEYIRSMSVVVDAAERSVAVGGRERLPAQWQWQWKAEVSRQAGLQHHVRVQFGSLVVHTTSKFFVVLDVGSLTTDLLDVKELYS